VVHFDGEGRIDSVNVIFTPQIIQWNIIVFLIPIEALCVLASDPCMDAKVTSPMLMFHNLLHLYRATSHRFIDHHSFEFFPRYSCSKDQLQHSG